MRELAATLFRNKRLIGLFVLMVIVPALVFSVLIVRAIRSEELSRAYETVEQQREIARLAEADLNEWLFSAGADSAQSQAVLRFEIAADSIVFPDLQLTVPANAAPRVRPFESLPGTTQLTTDTVITQYYPRIQAFLRDGSGGRHRGAQYFLRLRGLVVQPRDSERGYVVQVAPLVDHVDRKLASLCTDKPFTATVWIAETERKTAPAVATYGMRDFPFFEVVFADSGLAGGIQARGQAFVYAMTLLVAITVLGSVFVHRALSHEIRLSHLRNEFVAAVSHEFRSPLTSILALAERLTTHRTMTTGQLDEYHRIIEHDARRLSVLVTRLLEFGRIEAGKATYDMARADLVSIARDAIESVHHGVDASRLQLIGAEAAPLWVRADLTALSHAIQNLVENAAKYSPAYSPIEVSCRSANGCHIVEVRDRGIGIPAAEQRRIFEKFYRGHAVAGLNVQGVGIGLALVKHVVEQHGGYVSVESRVGQGSRFCLRLPAVEA